ncbi:MAG: hypothetical protein AB7R89_17645 [Dehalococcoidia bacterium]
MKLQTSMRPEERSGTRPGWGTVFLVVAGFAAALLLVAAVRWQDSGDRPTTPMAAPITATMPQAPGFGGDGVSAGAGMTGAIAAPSVQQSSPARPECEVVAYPTTC